MQVGAMPIFRVRVMPEKPEPKALYFVRHGLYAVPWLTDKDGKPLPVGNVPLIQDILADYLDGMVIGDGTTDPDIVDPGDLTLAFDQALA